MVDTGNIGLLIDYVREKLISDPSMASYALSTSNVTRVFPSQKKPSDPQDRHIVLAYDLDMRAKWAAVDDARFYITVFTAKPEELPGLVNTIITLLHNPIGATYTPADQPNVCLVIYKLWHEGGPPSPMHDTTKNMWRTDLQFSASIA